MLVYSCNAQNNSFYNSIIELQCFEVVNGDLRLRQRKECHDTSSKAGSTRDDELAVYYRANKTIVSFEVSTVVKLYNVESNILAMPWCCAACKMVSQNGYSLATSVP